MKGNAMFNEPALNNPHYNDCYFSYDDGLGEALYVFVDGNNIVPRLSETDSITIAETGFGTGLNLLGVIRAIRDAKLSNKTVRFVTVEKYNLSPERISELVELFREQVTPELPIFLEAWKKCYETLQEGWNSFRFEVDAITIEVELFNGDVIPFLESLSIQPDAWFLDGHSPDKNPDMWNPTVFGLVAEKSGVGTTVATFSAAGIVKRGLREGGFFIKRRKGFGGKRHMTVGWVESDQDSITEE